MNPGKQDASGELIVREPKLHELLQVPEARRNGPVELVRLELKRLQQRQAQVPAAELRST